MYLILKLKLNTIIVINNLKINNFILFFFKSKIDNQTSNIKVNGIKNAIKNHPKKLGE